MRKETVMSTISRVLLVVLLVLAPALATAQAANLAFGGGAGDPDAEVEVTADTLTIDRDNGNVTFTGDVLVVQGAFRLTAAVLTVIYAPDAGSGQRIDRMEATGGVVFAMGEDAAEAREALYTPASRQLLLTGDVLVTQGAATITGERMTVDMDTGMGTVEGRVRTVLSPGAAP